MMSFFKTFVSIYQNDSVKIKDNSKIKRVRERVSDPCDQDLTSYTSTQDACMLIITFRLVKACKNYFKKNIKLKTH